MKKERKIKFPTKVYSREEGKTKFKAKEKATKLVRSVWEIFFSGKNEKPQKKLINL